jgi:glyoxylase-like metal-dependent hydrolase (beta-lactamase superfamily II)
VQSTFKKLYNLERGFLPDGRQFDHLFKDGETFCIGSLQATALHVPGHTPADMAYLVDDAAFVGDTLFMPDVGTARADFPGGDARVLYRSIRRLLALPPETRLFVCHDYPPESRAPAWETTVAEERRRNIHVRDGVSEDEFVAMRQARDATLEVPTLILPSIQVNVRAGQLPPPDDNGVSYLRIPLNAL